MEPVEIREFGLLLRPWRPADADAVHRACQDPLIQRWTGVPSPYLRDHAEGFVGEISPRAWAAGTGAPFGVFDAGTGALVGSCGLITITPQLRSAEIGYWTAPWARGRGVATAATRAVGRWAFDALGLRRLTWQAEVGNHASRLVALRAGFQVTGTLPLAQPLPGGLPDGWIGALLPDDLAGEPPAVPALTRLRAAVFSGPQPTLAARTGTGEGITLRPMTAGDHDAIIAACRDAESLRWTTVPDPYGPGDAEFFVGGYGPRRWAGGHGAVFAIADPAGAYAGSMELRLSDGDPAVADVGYLVAPGARGRGYAPAALRALCGWAVGALRLERIEWKAYVGNDASRRAAEKAGFTMEGLLRSGLAHRGGERRDAWLGSVLADDVKAVDAA
ncbi:MAG TPA: GNAT family N-acetyltransferase [Pilimelia sp.]|nr:GNAT family N-acetyltransferase [Pilimelia sp.]